MYKEMPTKKLDKSVIRYERTTNVIESFFTLAFFGILMILTIRFDWPRWLMAMWISLSANRLNLLFPFVLGEGLSKFRY